MADNSKPVANCWEQYKLSLGPGIGQIDAITLEKMRRAFYRGFTHAFIERRRVNTLPLDEQFDWVRNYYSEVEQFTKEETI